MKAAEGVTEELKCTQQMEWVQHIKIVFTTGQKKSKEKNQRTNLDELFSKKNEEDLLAL